MEFAKIIVSEFIENINTLRFLRVVRGTNKGSIVLKYRHFSDKFNSKMD